MTATSAVFLNMTAVTGELLFRRNHLHRTRITRIRRRYDSAPAGTPTPSVAWVVRAHPLRLFADLIGKPVWLAGIAAMVSGQVLGALALGGQDAHVNLVEPLLTTNLLFALGMARSLSDEQLRWREWAGAVGTHRRYRGVPRGRPTEHRWG